MASFQVSHTKLAGISVAVPRQQASNHDLNISEAERTALMRSTGIETRRIAPESLCASDLCIEAAEKLLHELKWEKEEIDVLVFVTQTPDYLLPGSSMLILEKMGIPNTCIPFDLNQGCAGYVYGLSSITSFLSATGLRKGLLLVGDTITRLISPEDNSLVPVFSDAGSATAIEFSEGADPIYFNLEADGAGAETIIVPYGGMRNPTTSESSVVKEDKPGVKRSLENLHMNGHEVFNFGLKKIAPNIEALLVYAGKEKSVVDTYVLHQANKLLNEAIRKKLGVEEGSFTYSLNEFGNTSCATIPVTLVSRSAEELQSRPLNLVLSGFGVGLSWGSAYITTHQLTCPDVIEV